MSEDIESDLNNKKLLMVGVAGIVFSLIVATVNYLVGVSAVLNFAIVMCLFIVLACSLAFVKVERKEQEAKLEEEIVNSIDEIMPSINRIVSLLDDIDAKLRQCTDLIDNSGKKLSDSTTGQLKAVIQIRDRLDERANTVRSMLDTRENEKIQQAKEMLVKPLTFKVNSVNSLVVNTQHLPDLPHDQWEPTLYSILERVQKEVESLV